MPTWTIVVILIGLALAGFLGLVAWDLGRILSPKRTTRRQEHDAQSAAEV